MPLFMLGLLGQSGGAGNAPGPWWYAIVTDTITTQFRDIDLAADTSGSAYYVYSSFGATSIEEPKIFKISNTGTVTWARRFSGSAWSQNTPRVVWTQGQLLHSGVNGTGSAQQNYAMTLNADGTSTAVARSTYITADTNTHFASALDATGNIYTAGMWLIPGVDYNNFIMQHTAAGGIGWSRFWTGNDPRGTINWGGSNLYYGRFANLYKFNSSGTLINSRSITTTPNSSSYGWKVALDSSENNFRAGSNGTNGFLFRFDTDLLMTWGKSFTGFTGISQYNSGAVLDSAGNMYAFFHAPGQNKSMLVVKANSSGTILWSRSFAYRISGAYPYIHKAVMATFSNTDLILTVNHDTTSQRPQIVVKLPADGTKTGTYTNGIHSFDWVAETPTFTTLSTPTYGTPTAPTSNTATTGTGVPSNAAWTNYAITKTDIP